MKLALHVGAGVAAGQLPPCRDPQIDALQHALQQHLDGTSGGRAVYVAGLPGTGAIIYAFRCSALSDPNTPLQPLRCARHLERRFCAINCDASALVAA